MRKLLEAASRLRFRLAALGSPHPFELFCIDLMRACSCFSPPPAHFLLLEPGDNCPPGIRSRSSSRIHWAALSRKSDRAHPTRTGNCAENALALDLSARVVVALRAAGFAWRQQAAWRRALFTAGDGRDFLSHVAAQRVGATPISPCCRCRRDDRLGSPCSAGLSNRIGAAYARKSRRGLLAARFRHASHPSRTSFSVELRSCGRKTISCSHGGHFALRELVSTLP